MSTIINILCKGDQKTVYWWQRAKPTNTAHPYISMHTCVQLGVSFVSKHENMKRYVALLQTHDNSVCILCWSSSQHMYFAIMVVYWSGISPHRTTIILCWSDESHLQHQIHSAAILLYEFVNQPEGILQTWSMATKFGWRIHPQIHARWTRQSMAASHYDLGPKEHFMSFTSSQPNNEHFMSSSMLGSAQEKSVAPTWLLATAGSYLPIKVYIYIADAEVYTLDFDCVHLYMCVCVRVCTCMCVCVCVCAWVGMHVRVCASLHGWVTHRLAIVGASSRNERLCILYTCGKIADMWCG